MVWFCTNINYLAFSWVGKHDGSAVSSSTESSTVSLFYSVIGTLASCLTKHRLTKCSGSKRIGPRRIRPFFGGCLGSDFGWPRSRFSSSPKSSFFVWNRPRIFCGGWRPTPGPTPAPGGTRGSRSCAPKRIPPPPRGGGALPKSLASLYVHKMIRLSMTCVSATWPSPTLTGLLRNIFCCFCFCCLSVLFLFLVRGCLGILDFCLPGCQFVSGLSHSFNRKPFTKSLHSVDTFSPAATDCDRPPSFLADDYENGIIIQNTPGLCSIKLFYS